KVFRRRFLARRITFLLACWTAARGWSAIKASAASSAIHRRANKRPNRFDLLHIEHAAPWRHLSLAVEHRIDEAIMVGRTQTREVERGAAAGVAQLIAVEIGAVVPVNRRARRDICVGGPGTIRRSRGEREQKSRDVQRWRPVHTALLWRDAVLVGGSRALRPG